jgi:hypothetical protein
MLGQLLSATRTSVTDEWLNTRFANGLPNGGNHFGNRPPDSRDGPICRSPSAFEPLKSKKANHDPSRSTFFAICAPVIEIPQKSDCTKSADPCTSVPSKKTEGLSHFFNSAGDLTCKKEKPPAVAPEKSMPLDIVEF